MYLFIILFFLTFIFVKFNKNNSIGECIGSIILRAFFSMIVSGFIIGSIIAISPVEIREWNSQPIYSLKMNDKLQGDFVLFFGDINNEKYYYYYLELKNGNKQYEETKAISIQVRNTDEIPPQKITYKEHYYLPEWIRYLTHKDKKLEVWGETKYEVLVIPKSAIQQFYDGNIK